MMTTATTNNSSPLVLVTGASGFIAKHTIHQLLQSGYRVRGTVRNEEEAQIASRAAQNSISLVTTDLTADDGWEDAVRNCDYVIHLASPYPREPPENRLDLVPAAREGTTRVLQAAFKEPSVERIVVTSSIVAMGYWKHRSRPTFCITEDCWTDSEWDAVPPYPLSKTLAERAVWDLCKTEEKERVVVVNPAMVWGPMFDEMLSTSSEFCKLFMTGGYPAVPKVSYPVVDVRDVAQLLVAALTAEHVGGRRLIASAETMSMEEIRRLLASRFPQYCKTSTRVMPNWLLWLASFFDKSLAWPLMDADHAMIVNNKYVSELTGVKFRPATEAICAMAQSLIDFHVLD